MSSRSRGSGMDGRILRLPATPAFFHEEALAVLPEVLRRFEADEPILVGHSDGASIALIAAAGSPVSVSS